MSAMPHQQGQSIPRPHQAKARQPVFAIAELCATYEAYLAKAAKARSALLRKYESKALHAWRVSLRRITATLDRVATALPGEQPDGVLAQLKDFRNATGGARDLDILLDETLPAFLAHGGHGERLDGELLHVLNARREQSHQAAVEGLKKARLTTATHHFHAWAEAHHQVSDDELRAAAAGVIDTRFRQLRQQLLAGAPSVKTCALAYGFWHLSDFSRSYRSQFGEAPSETLAASRRPGATRADPPER